MTVNLYRLGNVTFQIAPFNISKVRADHTAGFAEKALLGSMPRQEFVGEGVSTFELSGKIFPYHHLGALEILARLNEIRKEGKPKFLIRGDGEVLGWVVIDRISELSEHLASDGVGKVIDVAIYLKSTKTPKAEEIVQADV